MKRNRLRNLFCQQAFFAYFSLRNRLRVHRLIFHTNYYVCKKIPFRLFALLFSIADGSPERI